jgi:hypothetical protein
MKAEARDLTFLSTEGIVGIPFFQREYVWDDENWSELLDNLGTEGRSHFLGSLILKQQPAQSGAPKEVLVIDGQQRLTTLSILVKALYDSLSEDAQANARDALRAMLFFKKSVFDKAFHVKIQHSHVDRPDFERVIRAGIDGPAIDDATNGGRILACYRHFVAELKSAPWTEAKRGALFAHLLDQQNKMLVVIDLATTDDEQAIFDTINSSGVRLSGADIIKNALYQRAIADLGTDDAVTLYNEAWKQSFLGDQDAVAFWSTERLTGRLKRDNMEILLHAIAVIDGFYDPVKNTMGELPNRYKDRIGSLEDQTSVRSFATGIHQYAGVYREHFGSPTASHHFRFGDGTVRLMQLLEAFQVSTLHPLLLHALRQPEARARELIQQVERFLVRRVIAGGEMRGLNRLVKDLIADPNLLGSLERETTDDMVRGGLRSITNKLAGVILFWVELRRRSLDLKHDVKDLPLVYTLEHVMPQKWVDHWNEISPRKRADGTEMTRHELEADRKSKVYWIGNMTLLTANLNSALRNASFERKVMGEGKRRGIRDYAFLTVTREIVAEYERDKTWDEAKIEARQLKIEEEVLSMWPAPASTTSAPAA